MPSEPQKKFGESCFCGVENHEHGFGLRCIGWTESQLELVTRLTIRVVARDGESELDAGFRLNTKCAAILETNLRDEGYEVISIE